MSFDLQVVMLIKLYSEGYVQDFLYETRQRSIVTMPVMLLNRASRQYTVMVVRPPSASMSPIVPLSSALVNWTRAVR